jgi:hypothetical protein
MLRKLMAMQECGKDIPSIVSPIEEAKNRIAPESP